MIGKTGLPFEAFGTARNWTDVGSFTRVHSHMCLHVAVFSGDPRASVIRACINFSDTPGGIDGLLNRSLWRGLMGFKISWSVLS